MDDDRLKKQIKFIEEVEKLKRIKRQNKTLDNGRSENSAEHSWHVALMAIILYEHANDQSIDLHKVITMLLIHDIVEIDHGDTWLFDEAENLSKENKESSCANRVFGLLPDDQKNYFVSLWREFENQASEEAIFAASLDSFQPLLNHLLTGEKGTRAGKGSDSQLLTSNQILSKKKNIEKGSKALWLQSVDVIEESTRKGLYLDGE